MKQAPLAGGASRLAALLLPQICSIFSVVAPCHPGAALRDLVLLHRGRATSLDSIARANRLHSGRPLQASQWIALKAFHEVVGAQCVESAELHYWPSLQTSISGSIQEVWVESF